MADPTGRVHRCRPASAIRALRIVDRLAIAKAQSLSFSSRAGASRLQSSADCGSAHSVRIVLATVDQGPSGGAALHALNSWSETLGSFFTNATMVQIVWSATGGSSAPKLGMPVILMPFLIIQNTSWGWRPLITLSRLGAGFSPSENL